MTNVSELLAAQAARTPHAVAVALGDRELTYRQLDERANRLGRHLADLGVRPDTVVALCLPRSIDMIVALFGILRAGGAYLPLEPSTPAERLSLILESARPQLVVTEVALAAALTGSGATAVCLDRDQATIEARSAAAFDSGVAPANLAYVIYTSGSTGVPKGIMIDHGALRDKVLAKTAIYGFTPRTGCSSSPRWASTQPRPRSTPPCWPAPPWWCTPTRAGPRPRSCSPTANGSGSPVSCCRRSTSSS